MALLALLGFSITNDLIEFNELNKKCGFNCADKLSNFSEHMYCYHLLAACVFRFYIFKICAI